MIMGNIDQESECQECGETNILDSTLNICFDCWCLLDLKEHESQQENAASEEEQLRKNLALLNILYGWGDKPPDIWSPHPKYHRKYLTCLPLEQNNVRNQNIESDTNQ